MKAVDVYVGSNEIGGKWLSRTEIPANWQRGRGLAPLFPLILEWSVCQGDTLGLASMNYLFRQLSGPPGGSAALRRVASTFRIAFMHLFRKMGRGRLGLVYREGLFLKHFDSDV